MRKTIFTAVLGLASALPALGQTPVRVAEVRNERVQQRQAVTGSLRAVARGQVAALEAGQLIRLTVREGDSVSQGDVIGEIDSRRLEAQKSAAEADLRVAQAELKRHQAIAARATSDLARGEELNRRNAASQQELDGFRAALDVASAEIESVKRQIERANETIRLLDIRLSDTKIAAPYGASVVARHVEVGDWVQPGDPLLTLVSTGPVEAWLEVPERFSKYLLNQNAVTVRSEATSEPLRVLHTKRIADVNPRVRTIHLVATIDNPSGLLAPGMSVRGWVPAGIANDFLTVPKDAIVRRSGQPTVFAVDDEAKANQISIRVLFETENRVAVESPLLKSGTTVIVEGNERLMPQTVVKVVPDRAPTAGDLAKR